MKVKNLKEVNMKSKKVGNYTVFSNGDIFSNNERKVFLKGWFNRKGYSIVKIDGVTKSRHKVVSEAFLGDRPSGMTINHIDGDKLNNDVSNLEYITEEENRIHALKNGLKRNIQHSLTLDVCSDLVEFYENTGVSKRELSKLVGFSRTAINPLLNGNFNLI
tara:strand:+ start:291 stop:773 length:483 start_codon:yes stop_codon:yes gene_type:complete